MAEGHNLVDSMKLCSSNLKKLAFPTAVMESRRHLLPPTLQLGQSRQAGATLKSGNREFSVTFSLGRTCDRLVLLETGWKDVVDQLALKEGDRVKISLGDRASSTYLIELLERVLAPDEGPKAEEAADVHQGGEEVHINLDQGGNAHATTAASTSAPFSCLQSGNKSSNMEFDLNKPPVESD
ncbi:hypothetical protein SLEP1_g20742 [Rubroshorea leprosula]|uniref:TF-B3 domain-containing protein n=1 Tax=Rubroshorea leprosula TaxID=152421 RepID=A0AAV5J919_9ROSI|nr:hypothetical protein SLEP1_g20742 [Rubroshorea leprosula]